MGDFCKYITVFKRFKIAPDKFTVERRVLYPRVTDKLVTVILLCDSPSLGRKGAILSIPRGLANYHMIPQGRAAYANWQNVDIFAKAKDFCINCETGKDEYTSLATAYPELVYDLIRNGTPEDLSTDSDRMANQVLTFKINTLSKDRKRARAPLSLYRILDVFSKRHQIDLLPCHIVGLVHLQGAKMCDKRIPTTGEYNVVARLPLIALHANAVAFTLNLAHLDDQ
ncbi:hypothetical protein, conserved [Babesia bigemina]|uniref:Ribosomal protein L9 domain-containing protein n=1 Tax=Babesia bigemina TaxID=5866 RepID=A0A061D463_BABBI|nr:hypothetical protein, conserved [Babesia bigemina]CDR95363.1 hypothetical protein, conserved [Babesia bigemina]|eukprot:XP_012767549.1 hypothetical protein, conserved [Babesia bigemina]